eukprot:7024987-Heterocapsa_arctica.AAC.1
MSVARRRSSAADHSTSTYNAEQHRHVVCSFMQLVLQKHMSIDLEAIGVRNQAEDRFGPANHEASRQDCVEQFAEIMIPL